MKNILPRPLPARRTVGSIIRQIQTTQQKDNDQNGTNAVSKTSGNAGNAKNPDPVCDICAQNVPGHEREKIYAFGKCDHHVCYVCSARLRAICDQPECPICREKLDKVIFSANKTKPFDAHDLKSYQYDEKHRIYFETEKIRAAFEKILNIECLKCLKAVDKTVTTNKNDDKNQKKQDPEQKKKQETNNGNASTTPTHTHVNKVRHFSSVQKLKDHLESSHRLKLCDLCLKHNNLFPFEYSYYNYESLKRHILKGEPNTSHRGHPRCKLCDNIFFNLDDLIQHMSREHYHCHLCGRHNTTQHIYFFDYPSLRTHFKTKHILCERDNCRHEQFTSAFDTQVDYQLHLVQVHETNANLTRGEARQQRTITLEATSHRQTSHDHQDSLPSNAAIVSTGTLATANNPRRQIPEQLRAQIIQQRLPSRADFPALGNGSVAPRGPAQGTSRQQSSENDSNIRQTSIRASFVRSIGGQSRPPDQLNEMDFPPLPEQPKKVRSNRSKASASKPKTTNRSDDMTLDQLISSSLTLSARNSKGTNRTNKANKSSKPRPIKIQL